MLTPSWTLEMEISALWSPHLTGKSRHWTIEQELHSALAHLRKGLELAVIGGLGFCFMLGNQKGPCYEGDIWAETWGQPGAILIEGKACVGSQRQECARRVRPPWGHCGWYRVWGVWMEDRGQATVGSPVLEDFSLGKSVHLLLGRC